MPTRFEKLVAEAKKNITEVPPEEVAEAAKTGEPLIIDVRDPEESCLARIPNAKTISRGTLEIEIEEIAPDTAAPIICYCGGGGRGALAAESLQRMGYTNVKSIAGGFKAWKSAGLPVQQ
jgi:Rhodanese-related sulfurtransferase